MSNDVLRRLAATIKDRRTARPEDSHTRRLLDGAPVKPAKKLGEEAVEVAIAALAQDKGALIAETADLLYHLLVVLESRHVALDDERPASAELLGQHRIIFPVELARHACPSRYAFAFYFPPSMKART